jgi:hypothetical protein
VQNGTRNNVPWNEENYGDASRHSKDKKERNICRFGHVDDRLPIEVR